MDVMATPAAAARLGISTRQVQRLVTAGTLTRVAGNVVTAESVARALAARPTNAPLTRAWAEPTAWAALAVLSDRNDLAQAIGASQASRLRSNLRRASPETLAASLRDRAQVRRYDAHTSAIARIRTQVIAPRIRDTNLTTTTQDLIDGYIAPAAAATAATEFALRPAVGAANVVLRVTTYPHVDQIAEAGDALAGADLVESLDPRERAEGRRILARALERYAR